MTPEKLKQMFARANKTNWSWLLPGIALGLTYYFTDNYEIWFVSDSLNIKYLCFNLLVPILALWLLTARQTEPRVLIWTSIPATIMMLSFVPVFASYIYLFNTESKWLRIVGQSLLALISLVTTILFVSSLFWFEPIIYKNGNLHKNIEQVQAGEVKAVLVADNEVDAKGKRIETEKPLGKWLKIVHPVARLGWKDGYYSDLKVSPQKKITVNYHSPDEDETTVENMEFDL